MRKVQGQPNEFGIFVKQEAAPAPAPAPSPAPEIEEPAAEEAPAAEVEEIEEVEGSEDTGWTRSKKRKSK